MYVCMYVCTCVRVCVCVCVYVCMYVCMHACMYVCMYVCMHVSMHGWMDGWIYVCISMYIYIYSILYLHTHAHKGNQLTRIYRYNLDAKGYKTTVWVCPKMFSNLANYIFHHWNWGWYPIFRPTNFCLQRPHLSLPIIQLIFISIVLSVLVMVCNIPSFFGTSRLNVKLLPMLHLAAIPMIVTRFTSFLPAKSTEFEAI